MKETYPDEQRWLRPHSSESSRIGTTETVRHIQAVIKDTVVPSWLTRVPRNYGEAAAGSLKADEQRVLATVYLPIALISRWCPEANHTSDGARDRAGLRLESTMLLVQIILIFCSRVLTLADARIAHQYLRKYIEGIKSHHPHNAIKPNHHMAFHILDYIILFGPVRGWWTFPFERLIGRLQAIPTNHNGKSVS